tara:strand:+ start:7154 stop:7567 length:414 start_codon:yes stop_codon:yes gene_type:complete
MTDCLFCKIINKEISSDIVYEDKNFIAFLDINPVNKCHTLVMPKKHSKNLLEDNEEDLKLIGPIMKKIGNALVRFTNADGLNIITNINEVAGQEIFHTHIHLLPRFKNDGVSFKVKREKYKNEGSQEIASKIKNLLK